MTHTRFLMAFGAGVLAIAASGTATADPVRDFYKGKRMTMFVGSGAGGGYDTYTRAFVRTYRKHIPGQPKMVVKNMQGAAGLRVTNYMYNKAKRDGSHVASTFNTMMLEPLLGNRKAKFDVFKFNWLGSLGKLLAICTTWHTSPIKTLEDAKKRPINVSATGATSNMSKMPRIFNWAVGTQFRVIQGYSTAGSRLALERGEVEGICGLGYSTMLAANPDWILQGKLNILAQIGLYKHPKLPHVPSILQNITDEKARKVVELLLIAQEPGRPYVAPPEVPADRVAALTAAFEAAAKDPAFLADAKKLRLEITFVDAKTIQGLHKRAYAASRETAEAAAKLIGRPAKGTVTSCSQYTKQASWCRKKKKSKKKKAS
ncbi:MAG: tripartite tricarboxylate transporter substrate-binding protein [Alphaproteobacteria bacterium]|nr:tripartite tricarboxylate transporter substrate-binding protein [Alphaproteobacteria bacterium]